MSLRHAVLGLLTGGPASGYDLLKIFEISLANVWPATQSQLYTELGRLADAGHVMVTESGSRGRKEYAITDAGLAELRHWLVEVEPSRVQRSDLLLRVFFLNDLSPEEARAYLRREGEFAAEQHRQFTELRKVVAEREDPLSTNGLIVLDYALRVSAAKRDWAEWAQTQIPEASVHPA